MGMGELTHASNPGSDACSIGVSQMHKRREACQRGRLRRGPRHSTGTTAFQVNGIAMSSPKWWAQPGDRVPAIRRKRR